MYAFQCGNVGIFFKNHVITKSCLYIVKSNNGLEPLVELIKDHSNHENKELMAAVTGKEEMLVTGLKRIGLLILSVKEVLCI